MWMRITLLLIFIKLSEETCELKYTRLSERFILCTDITPNDDIHSNILPIARRVYKLIITNSSIPELSKTMCVPVSLDRMTIHANAEVIENNAFETCDVKSLILDCNHIKKIGDMSFSSALRILSLENNSLNEIRVNNFQGLSELIILNLKCNNISEIEEDSFDDLTQLEELDLSFNKLEELHFGQFKSLSYLKTIYLNSNLLKELSDHIFSECKSLTFINIDHNFITIIDARSYPSSVLFVNASNNQLMSADFSNLTNVDTIDLKHNSLVSVTNSLGNLTSLKHLILSYNSFGPSIKLTKMQILFQLDISYNNLEEIGYDTFENTTELNELSLQYNSIHTIELGCFRNLEKLQKLNLGHNKIKSFELGIFSGLHFLNTLDISYNNLSHLDKNIFHSTMFLKDLNIAYNNLKDVEIINMRFRTVGLEKATLTGNEWNCNSLADIIRSHITVTRGTFYNVSNIFGIPCNNFNNTSNNRQLNDLGNPVNFSKFLEYLDSNEKSEQQISYKLTLIITALMIIIIALLIMFGTLASPKCYSWYIAVKEFISKKPIDGQEIQLM